MLERRRYVRIPEHAQICYEVIPGEKMRESLTKNISRGGIRFLVRDFIPKDSRLKIRLDLHEIPFNFEAIVKVVWIKQIPHGGEYEVGVEFTDMPDKAAQHLLGYIRAFLNVKDE